MFIHKKNGKDLNLSIFDIVIFIAFRERSVFIPIWVYKWKHIAILVLVCFGLVIYASIQG